MTSHKNRLASATVTRTPIGWLRLDKARGWATRLSGAVLDQAFFAGSNFVLNILLARWLTPDQYGAFVVAYAWFLFPQNIYEAVITEPLTIFGAGRFGGRFKDYLGWVYYAHGLISLLVVVLLGGAAFVASQTDGELVASAIAGAALIAPLLLTRWLTRYPFYVLSTPQHSALGGFIYLVLSLGGLIILLQTGTLTAVSALIVMGVTGLISSWVMSAFYLKPTLRLQPDADLNLRSVLGAHWSYGKWASITRMLAWLPMNINYIVLPLFLGLAGSAALRAMMNLILPLQMTITAITAILLPALVRAYERDGKAGMTAKLRTFVQLAAGITGLYALALVIFGQPVIHLVYDGQYDEFVTLPVLITLGLIPVLTAVTAVVDAALRASGNVKLTLFANIVPALLSVTLGLILLVAFGVLGANLGSLIVTAVMLATMIFYYRRIPKTKTVKEPDL